MARAKCLSALLLVTLRFPLANAQTTTSAAAAPQPARGSSQEILAYWSQVGHRLIEMAQDFPEDKYGFKPQKDQRSFAENFVHVANEDYRLRSEEHTSELQSLAYLVCRLLL